VFRKHRECASNTLELLRGFGPAIAETTRNLEKSLLFSLLHGINRPRPGAFLRMERDVALREGPHPTSLRQRYAPRTLPENGEGFIPRAFPHHALSSDLAPPTYGPPQ
jgi:hypothetical protein